MKKKTTATFTVLAAITIRTGVLCFRRVAT